jgi:hypothetical protein
VVIQAPRKFDITRILRYKVQMKATNPLLTLGLDWRRMAEVWHGLARNLFW